MTYYNYYISVNHDNIKILFGYKSRLQKFNIPYMLYYYYITLLPKYICRIDQIPITKLVVSAKRKPETFYFQLNLKKPMGLSKLSNLNCLYYIQRNIVSMSFQCIFSQIFISKIVTLMLSLSTENFFFANHSNFKSLE